MKFFSKLLVKKVKLNRSTGVFYLGEFGNSFVAFVLQFFAFLSQYFCNPATMAQLQIATIIWPCNSSMQLHRDKNLIRFRATFFRRLSSNTEARFIFYLKI